jgi:hypothetical protein
MGHGGVVVEVGCVMSQAHRRRRQRRMHTGKPCRRVAILVGEKQAVHEAAWRCWTGRHVSTGSAARAVCRERGPRLEARIRQAGLSSHVSSSRRAAMERNFEHQHELGAMGGPYVNAACNRTSAA